jgi:hypothetical protein
MLVVCFRVNTQKEAFTEGLAMVGPTGRRRCDRLNEEGGIP